MSYDKVKILGINFFRGSEKDVFNLLIEKGGLLTVPAAPALVNIKSDSSYYQSLLGSDIVIPDSGYMILIWNLLSNEKINKISGLMFINYFIKKIKLMDSELFLINPSNQEGAINKAFFSKNGLNINNEFIYTAPYYKESVKDVKLLQLLEINQPKWILINIGGGTQEKLGYFLKKNLTYKPAIICTGAALAFKTGSQVNIPSVVDKIHLGWLSRCISNPKIFIPRYLGAFKLISLLLKYKSEKVIY